MQIEVHKLIAANQAMTEKLEAFNRLAGDQLAKQAVADEADRIANAAKAELLKAVAEFDAMLDDILARNQPELVGEVESSNSLTGLAPTPAGARGRKPKK